MIPTPSNWLAARDRFESALLQDVLPFWFPRCVDADHGGYLTSFDRRGDLVDSDKSVWAQGRMTWMLLSLFNRVRQEEAWLDWAEQGLQFIDRHCFDSDGRLLFHVTRDGKPIRKRRYSYSEAFAAIAFAAHAQATGNSDSADTAQRLYGQFMKWHFTPGLIPPKFESTRPTRGLGPYMIGLVTGQELRRSLGPDTLVETYISDCLNAILDDFVSDQHEVVFETVGNNGPLLDHFDGRLLNPGHAIEAAWFVMEEGHWRNDPGLVERGVTMLDWMWDRGWDRDIGGILYFCDLDGKPVQEYWHEMKFWWPHNETMIATLMAATRARERAIWVERFGLVCDWSFRHFSDPEYGEWFGYLRRDGSVSSELKGGLWKSFFHLPRSLLTCCEILGETESNRD